MKITAIIGTRNEAHKIRTALTHCLLWADEVVVVDKDSTDATRDIALEMGARAVNAGFSRQGHENVQEQVSHASHDWVWIWTSHEVPTKKLIEAGRAMATDDVDLIMVPMYYYSFGVHHDQSPWAGGWQPRLFHRGRVKFTGIAHAPMHAERTVKIPYLPDQYVLHQTHAPVERFMISHLDYMVNEAANGNPEHVFLHAMQTAVRFDEIFKANPELLPQALGWKVYWFGVALHAWERLNPGVPEQYAARCRKALEEWA